MNSPDVAVTDGFRGSFYVLDGEDFVARHPATGPWDKRFVNGVALSGLLAYLLELEQPSDQMDIVRFHMDIFKRAAMTAPISAVRPAPRVGRRMRTAQVHLIADEEVVAGATAVYLRVADTPVIGEAAPVSPESLNYPPVSTRGPMRGLLKSKLIRGGLESLGPGEGWFRFDADIVPGVPITPFVATAMAADFGSGLSSVLDWREYSFANIDISMNLTRPPLDAWINIRSETVTEGRGHASVNTVIGDRCGEFARAHQTLLLERRT